MNRLLTLSSLLAIVAFTGCNKPAITEEKTAEVVDKSIFSGSVLPFGQQGINALSDRSGVTVSLENSSPLISTNSDVKGNFTLKIDPALKAFTLVYTKPDFGTYKEYYGRSNDSLYVYSTWLANNQSRYYLSPENRSTPNLGPKSTVVVNSVRITSPVVNGQVKITCNVTGSGSIQLFYQCNKPITSFDDIPKTQKNMSGTVAVHDGDNTIDYCARCCLYEVAGMKSGDTVYMMAQGNGEHWNDYFDRTTNQYMMPNISRSNVTPVSFVLP